MLWRRLQMALVVVVVAATVARGIEAIRFLRCRRGQVYILVGLWLIIALPLMFATMLELPGMLQAVMQARQGALRAARSVAFSCFDTDRWSRGGDRRMAAVCPIPVGSGETPAARTQRIFETYLEHQAVDPGSVVSALGNTVDRCRDPTIPDPDLCFRITVTGEMRYTGILGVVPEVLGTFTVRGDAEGLMHYTP